MTYETLLWEQNGAVVHLTLNRPDRRNALTFPMMRELTTAFERTAADPDIRVLVLQGAGGHFSAGGDLAQMRSPPEESGPDPVASAYRRMGEALAALDGLPQAVVAIVEGACVGGGLGMACAADYVITTASAKFGMPEARAGFIPSQILPTVVQRIGEGQALRLAVTARIIDGAEAGRIGIAHEVVPDHVALQAAKASVLSDLTWAEPLAVAEIKRLIRLTRTQSTAAVLDDAAGSLSRLLDSPAAAEGITAFQEKRPPNWAKP